MKLFRFAGIIIFILFFSLSDASAQLYCGIVVNHLNTPVSNAIVRIQGTKYSTRTDIHGKFKIEIDKKNSAKYITAWKSGFYNGGELILSKNTSYQITLSPIKFSDDIRYEWLPAIKSKVSTITDPSGESQPCINCHPRLVPDWQKDVHSKSATNPVFFTFFNGTDLNDNKNKGPGFKSDFKESNGNCVACHIPTMALRNSINANPNEAIKTDKEGISCDFCHKIENASIDRSGAHPGVLSYQFRRPSKGHQIFYGPYDDVYPGDDSFHPLYSKSNYCAPCHHGKFWGVLVYSEFQEWKESSYSKKDVHCQDCHMKPDGKISRFVPKDMGGLDRDPSTIPSHLNFGISDKKFMREAISLKTNANINKNLLTVTVKVENTNAGHHYPTGNPMRHMILLIETVDNKGNSLLINRGSQVPFWGGIGLKENGDYAGLPGKAFAKVLKNRPHFGINFKKGRDYKSKHPVPHWRRTIIESDNRIPANSFDLSTYEFNLPAKIVGNITITAKLIFRKSYKKWLDAKKINLNDMEIGRSTLIVTRK